MIHRIQRILAAIILVPLSLMLFVYFGLFALLCGVLFAGCMGLLPEPPPEPPEPPGGSADNAKNWAYIYAGQQVPSPVNADIRVYDAKQNPAGEWLVTGHIDHHPPNLHAPIRDEWIIKLKKNGPNWVCVESTLQYQYAKQPGLLQ